MHLNPSGSAWSRPDLAARPRPDSFPASRAQTGAICAVLEASMLPAVLFSSFVIAQTAVFPGIILEVLQAILYIDPHCICQRCAKHPHTRNKGDTRLLQGENRLRNSAHLNLSGSAWSRPDLAAHPGLDSFPASRAQTSAICVVRDAV